jgi:hypothetical protein
MHTHESGLKDYILLEKSFARFLGIFNKGLIQSVASESSKIAISEISEVTALCGSVIQRPSVPNHMAKPEVVSANHKNTVNQNFYLS